MQILVIGKFYVEGFALHIEQTLVKMGHSVIRFDPFPDFEVASLKKPINALWQLYQRSPSYEKIQTKRLIRLANAQPIDIVISCHDFLTPRQVQELRTHTHASIVLWFPDAVSNFGKAMFLVADYNHLFFKDTTIANRLTAELGLHASYLPECCNPYSQYPVVLTAEDHQRFGCDISTAGNFHAARMAVLRKLTAYQVRVWGHEPPYWSVDDSINKMAQCHFVANEEKSKAFLASKIVLNSIHPAEISGVNVRTFEIAAIGAFQLTSFRQDLPDLFDLDEELICYHSLTDLEEKVQYYLAHPELRARIAKKAKERAIKDHTYEIRLRKIFQMVGRS